MVDLCAWQVNLSELEAESQVHAVRYAWPLGNAGDTCCPGADVAAGLTVCAPANCPLFTNDNSLPANPFFARIEHGKCTCRKPQVCDA